MKKVISLFFIVTIVFAALQQTSPINDDTGKPITGYIRASVLVYSDSGELIWTGTTDGGRPALRINNGYIHNIEDILPVYVKSMDSISIDIVKDGVSLGRFVYTPPEGLRRESPEETGEILETMDDELQIGREGEDDELYIASARTGFGIDAPTERVEIDGALGLKGRDVPTALADFGKVYVDSTDGHLYFVDEAGNITDLTVDANALQSVSSSANTTGRTSHMRFIPGTGTDITESATDDTIFIQYNVNVTTSGAAPCSDPPSSPLTPDGVASVCSGEPGTSYGVPPVDGATYYRWTLPDGSNVINGFGTNVIQAIMGYTDGNVCVAAVNGCGVSTPACLAVTIERPSSPGSISGPDIFCEDDTGISYSIDAVPDATNYIWTVPPGAIVASGSGTPSITVNFGSSGGELCVQTENYCGRSEPECYPVSMTVIPSTPGVISGPATVCEYETETYSISSVASATSYSWTVPSGATIDAGDGTTSIEVSFGETSGNVTVAAVSICGSSSPSTKAITVAAAPEIVGSSSDITVDEGDPATFSVTATGAGLSYLWQRSTDGGSTWIPVGSDASSYSTGSTTESMTGYLYRCIVSGDCIPPDTSSVMELTVISEITWVQTSQSDFEAGIGTNITTTASPGDVSVTEASFRYLQLYVVQGYDGTYLNIGEITYKQDGVDYPGPAMTGFTSPSPLVASSNSPERTTYGYAWMPFSDICGSNTNLWYPTARSNVYLRIDLGAGNSCSPDQVVMKTGQGDYRAPRDFRIEGSNTGAFSGEETVLLTVTNASWVNSNCADNTWALSSAMAPTGTIASQVLNTTRPGSGWVSLSWVESLPSGTDITFEVRASDTPFSAGDGSPSWTSVGGTSPVTGGMPSGQYKQWRATLSTSGSNTPTLSEVTVIYD